MAGGRSLDTVKAIMRLTVGSLPASVYWRRRALVLGVLLLAVIVLWTSCSGSPRSDASKTVGELVTGLAATTGENVRVRRFTRFQLGEAAGEAA